MHLEQDRSVEPLSGCHSSLSEAAVRQQLSKILASSDFQTSPMLRDFIRFIVEKTLAGQAQEIKGYTVATQVLGRKADFDAGKDPIVRILAGRLRRALERYYSTQGRQDPVRIDIPKGAYVPMFQEVLGDERPSSVAQTGYWRCLQGRPWRLCPFSISPATGSRNFLPTAWPKN